MLPQFSNEYDPNGAPSGYNQIQPGLDQPKAPGRGTPPRPQTPLQNAILPAQYPVDPGFAKWRERMHPDQQSITTGEPDYGNQNLPSLPAPVTPATSDPSQGGIPPAAPPATPGQYRSALQGFDWGKLDNPQHVTIKYKVARVLQNYPPTVDSVPKIVADLNSQGIKATQISKDKVDIEGAGVVDILQNASQGGTNWWWGTQGPAPAADGNTPLNNAVLPGGAPPDLNFAQLLALFNNISQGR